MAKVTIGKNVVITIDGKTYSEEDARKIYEALKDHFEPCYEEEKTFKEILDEFGEVDGEKRRVRSPFPDPLKRDPWRDPWPHPQPVPYPYPWTTDNPPDVRFSDTSEERERFGSNE